MGNGESLEISHVGSSFLLDNKSLYFKKYTSRVQRLHKNLINVSKFTIDNNVYFEFHPKLCFVEDQATGITLLRGRVREGCYFFPSAKHGMGRHTQLSSRREILSVFSNSPTSSTLDDV